MTSEFRTVPGFTDYEVSASGCIRRRVASKRGHPAGNIVRPWLNNAGYSIVTMSGPDGAKRRPVSRVVCEAFHGPAPTPEHQAAHNDGDPGNNHASNLRWATRVENMADCLRHGTRAIGDRHGRKTKPDQTCRGEKHGGAKLTSEAIRTIRLHPAAIGTGVALARQFSVSASLICRIRKNKAWRHL